MAVVTPLRRHDDYCVQVSGEPDERGEPCDCRRGAVVAVRAALTSEDEIAHAEASDGVRGLGQCAYCDDEWPCRTQRAIDRLLAALDA